MKKLGEGILPPSEICFSYLSAKARSMFYHALCAGHFFCDENYHLKRTGYDSMLILHVIDGNFRFLNNEGVWTDARKNETVVLDCYKEHEYYTSDTAETLWVHIAGVNTRDLCNDVIHTNGNIVKARDAERIKSRMFKILEGIKLEKALGEAELSLEVYKLLMEITGAKGANVKDDVREDLIGDIKDYIVSNTGEKITVDNLASRAHMSTTHFSRVFKQKTGFSPYDYVLTARINKAKELLLKTEMSVVQIAYETGFNSEANFIYCFTKNEGISPGKFRKIQF